MALEDEMRRIQRDLDSDLYRDAETRFLHRAADIKVLNIIYAILIQQSVSCTIVHRVVHFCFRPLK